MAAAPNKYNRMQVMMRKAAAAATANLMFFGLCALAPAQSQPLSPSGYAQTRGEGEPSGTKLLKVYDNDNLPITDGVSVVGIVGDAAADSNDDAASNSAVKPDLNRKSKDAAEIEFGQSLQERRQAYEHWKMRITERRERVDRLARELEGLKLNAPMSVAILHLWPDDQMYSQLIAEKQKALDEAEANLSDMQEQARRAGVPSSFRDGEVEKKEDEEDEQDGKTEHAAAMSEIQARKAAMTSPQTDDGTYSKGVGAISDSRTKETPKKEKKDVGEIKPGQSPEERREAYAAWKKRIEEGESKIDTLARALDDLKRDVPTAVMLHLWPEDQLYLQLVTDKQKALDAAKVDLSNLQEQARKAGVPSAFTY
ncbi:MAG: hypothetical protein ACRD3P_14985 [Terriglobales bacterium]